MFNVVKITRYFYGVKSFPFIICLRHWLAFTSSSLAWRTRSPIRIQDSRLVSFCRRARESAVCAEGGCAACANTQTGPDGMCVGWKLPRFDRAADLYALDFSTAVYGLMRVKSMCAQYFISQSNKTYVGD